MLTRTIVVLVLVLSHSAFAGTVVFDPPVALTVTGEPAVFQVSIGESDLARFDVVSIWLQSDAPGFSVDFEYDAAFLRSLDTPPFGPWVCNIFSCMLSPGGINLQGWQAPVVIGGVIIDTTSLPAGAYEIFVSAALETELFGAPFSIVASGLVEEPLEGRAVLYAGVPEPTTLALLIPMLAAATQRCRRCTRGGL